jgi:hypothetical protein
VGQLLQVVGWHQKRTHAFARRRSRRRRRRRRHRGHDVLVVRHVICPAVLLVLGAGTASLVALAIVGHGGWWYCCLGGLVGRFLFGFLWP